MERSKEQLDKLVQETKGRYFSLFHEPMPEDALKLWVNNFYQLQQEEFFSKHLGHLSPDDTALLHSMLSKKEEVSRGKKAK